MFKSHAICNHPLSRVIFCGLLLLPPSLANAAGPADLCTDMTVLTKHAQSNFLQNHTNAAARPLPGAEKCTMARSLSGANTYHCAWGFSYRSSKAIAAFDAFDREMRACFGASTKTRKDQRVNHPDSYEQHQYQLDQVVVTVSLKDKITLQKTYVFIGVQGAVPDD